MSDPSDPDFYALVATARTVLGAGIGDDPDTWEAAVGPDHLDVPGDGLLRRDHGLVEISFAPAPGGRMACFGFGVKIHRLIHDRTRRTVPSPLSRRYGPFAPRIRFDELRARVTGLGHTVETDDGTGDIHRYRVAESGARIFVIADPDPYARGDHEPPGPQDHQAGDVWSIDVSPAWWDPR
ncbi:hypothetical protein B4N89_38235 [Embleya scabrispora]|uniref:Uncharacterized protein n=1 Tax=Embleya scabrispora TaxID=159449 RepID=A0A1T3NP36_9ACTN|nr:hypothetical protein B4N89_38235 [Embleya scabrispora]